MIMLMMIICIDDVGDDDNYDDDHDDDYVDI